MPTCSVKRLNACKRLKLRMTPDKINKIWFFDERIFSVKTPTNMQSKQPCVCKSVDPKRDITPLRLLKGRKHYSKRHGFSGCLQSRQNCSILCYTQGQMNSVYYCDEVLGIGLLPDMRLKSGNDFVFQQDEAPAH